MSIDSIAQVSSKSDATESLPDTGVKAPTRSFVSGVMAMMLGLFLFKKLKKDKQVRDRNNEDQ
ncbi:hypothetical protein CD134_00720 [Staphylococcus lutrae]|nr:hypothetical protein CD134_00720 [Staphylococcus lutrae]